MKRVLLAPLAVLAVLVSACGMDEVTAGPAAPRAARGSNDGASVDPGGGPHPQRARVAHLCGVLKLDYSPELAGRRTVPEAIVRVPAGTITPDSATIRRVDRRNVVVRLQVRELRYVYKVERTRGLWTVHTSEYGAGAGCIRVNEEFARSGKPFDWPPLSSSLR